MAYRPIQDDCESPKEGVDHDFFIPSTESERSVYSNLHYQSIRTTASMISLEEKMGDSVSSSKFFHRYMGVFFIIFASFAFFAMALYHHKESSFLFATMNGSDGDRLGEEPMSIVYDEKNNIYKVIDNNPLFVKRSYSHSGEHVLANGSYVRNVNGNGWHYLSIQTPNLSTFFTHERQKLAKLGINSDDLLVEQYLRTMEALGYLEGYLTCHEMNAWYVNFYAGLFDGGDPTDESLEFLEENHDWMLMQAEENYLHSEYWLAVRGMLKQLDGMVAGTKAGCPGSEQSPSESPFSTTPSYPTTTAFDDPTAPSAPHREGGSGIYLPSLRKKPALIHLLLMNANGDLYQIAAKFQQDEAPASGILDELVNDDDYYFETHTHRKKKDDSATDSSGSSNDKRTSRKMQESESGGKRWNRSAFRSGKKDNGHTRKSKRTSMSTEPVATNIGEDSQTGTITELLLSSSRKSGDRSGSESESGGKRWSRLGKKDNGHTQKSERTSVSTEPVATNIGEDGQTGTITELLLSSARKSGDGKSKRRSFRDGRLPPRRLRVGPHEGSQPEHCSAIIKLLADRSDIVFGHNTWDDFQCAAPRIFKHYAYPRMAIRSNTDPLIASDSFVDVEGIFNVHFSSSPGLLSSVDDFYIVHGRGELAVMETTIDVYKAELLANVVPESMLSWARARLSNLLATSGESWAQTFSFLHSGTYVNQWMVMDLAKFSPGKDPQEGFLTVLEEVPGYIHSEDLTQRLIADGYWASYNNPYYPDISRFTGQDELCAQDPVNCHDTDPRAAIFRAQQGLVENLHDLQYLMGYNRFRTDPLSKNQSCSAIACRQDLDWEEENRYPFGAIDAKVSSVTSSAVRYNPFGINLNNNPIVDLINNTATIFDKKPMVLARLGPSADDQPVFCWKKFDDLADEHNKFNKRGHKYYHSGHPACFAFQWQALPPLPADNVILPGNVHVQH